MNKLTALFTFFIVSVSIVLPAYAQDSNNTVIFYDDNKEVAIQAELFEFESEQQRQDAVQLAKSLRCPQCQNQNLVESNAPVAKDLRLKVYQMVKQGKSDEEIIQFMTYRFGDFVLYDPVLSYRTLVLWLLPIVLIVMGLFLAFKMVKTSPSVD
ncbi:heme lyase NrfEFG subunit NrfF [Vibrio sp. MA40-2]|uniref:heme lyase NrfEFG subunit NrfF n=1 Tax=Vibrio sp. MA40-2 TaxID=3391828 RepID=UPI0039A5C8F0